jgi:hypothetical protein
MRRLNGMDREEMMGMRRETKTTMREKTNYLVGGV